MLGVHDDLCCPSTCVCKLQHSHHGCAGANMNQGGAPKGKRKATLLAEQNKRERDDPSLKEKREKEEKAVRNSFFECRSGQPTTLASSLTNTSADTGMRQQETNILRTGASGTPSHKGVLQEDTNILTTGAASTPSYTPGSLEVAAMISLPNALQDRQDNKSYSHRYSGRDIIVRWKDRGSLIVCTCDQSSTLSCKGGQRLNRCTSLQSSAGLHTSASSRPKVQRDYAAMAGSFVASGGRADAARDKVYAVEADRIEDLHEIRWSADHEAGLVVCKKGRWDKKLVQFEGWSLRCNGILFPLRIDAQWRKTFTGHHATVVKKKTVTILFTIILSSSTPECPVFQALDTEGGPFSQPFRAGCVHNLERKWLSQQHNVDEACGILKGRHIQGQKFIGFKNVNFAQFLLTITPEFERVMGERKDVQNGRAQGRAVLASGCQLTNAGICGRRTVCSRKTWWVNSGMLALL